MQRSSRLQSTNCTSAPARTAASGVAMNVFDGHSTVSPWTPGEVQRRHRPAGPAREGHGRDFVPRLPGRLEPAGQLGLGPAPRVEHLVDQRVQPRTIALVEADREPRVVWNALLGSGSSRGRSP